MPTGRAPWGDSTHGAGALVIGEEEDLLAGVVATGVRLDEVLLRDVDEFVLVGTFEFLPARTRQMHP